jgi:putative transposase
VRYSAPYGGYALLTQLGQSEAMSNYIRPKHPGATVYLTICLAEPGSDLLLREVEALRQAVRLTQSARPFRIDAWVVLPDHMHCVWTLPPGDAELGARVGQIKATFSKGLPPGILRPSHIRRREKGIWQRRFWEHHPRSPEEVRFCIRSCWMDPVRHGLVREVSDWPFSSWHRDHALAA